MPRSCAKSSARAICRAMCRASRSGSPGPSWRASRRGESCRRAFRLDELENQEPDLVRFLESVNGADVRMIQRRERARFAIEPREPAGITRERVRQDLDRDLAAELAVARAVDLAHAADADQRLHLIAAERRPVERARPSGQAGRHGATLPARNPSSDAGWLSRCSTSRRRSSSARHAVGQERRALVRRPRARRVVQRLDLLPALRRHWDRRSFPARATPWPAASRA